jgi:hypothetical protein
MPTRNNLHHRIGSTNLIVNMSAAAVSFSMRCCTFTATSSPSRVVARCTCMSCSQVVACSATVQQCGIAAPFDQVQRTAIACVLHVYAGSL